MGLTPITMLSNLVLAGDHCLLSHIHAAARSILLRQGMIRLSHTLAMHQSNTSLRADCSPDLLSLSPLKLFPGLGQSH